MRTIECTDADVEPEDICIVCGRPPFPYETLGTCRQCDHECHKSGTCAADYDAWNDGDGWQDSVLCARCR